MSKKSRRTNRRRSKSNRSVPVAKAARSTTKTSEDVDFAHEYHYVVEDLRRIAIIALVLLVLLIGLALLIS